MDQVTQDLGEKIVDNKRKWKGNNNNNNNNQNKCQEVAMVYTVGPTNKGKYDGRLPPADYRSPARATNQGNQNNQRNPPTYYGCGQQGNYKNECPEVGNQGRGNQIRGNQN
ncbi:reverse transcriptase domain-containing protein [Tanacetum coccineum]